MININLLPKHLRRVREPGYWRIIMVLFPLIVAGVLGAIEFTVGQTIKNLNNEVSTLEQKRQDLQQFVNKQNELNAELETMRGLLDIAGQVKANTIPWTSTINAMLETLPAQGDSARPRISFDNLTMEAITPPRSDEARYEGQAVNAEMSVTGQAASTEVLAEFIRSLENSEHFGVAFQNAARDDETGFYSYSLTIGALDGGAQ